MTTPLQQPGKPAPTRGAKIFGVLVVIAMFAACGFGVNALIGKVFRSPAPASTPADRSDEAKWACEQFVKKQLKAPATAKFSGEAAAKATNAQGDEYIASGSVDSQNSFGALLRSAFSCDITYDGTTQQWTSKSVTVE